MSTQKAARGGGRAAQRRAAQGAPPPVPSAPGAAPAAAAAASPNVIAAQAISLDSLNEMEQSYVHWMFSLAQAGDMVPEAAARALDQRLAGQGVQGSTAPGTFHCMPKGFLDFGGPAASSELDGTRGIALPPPVVDAIRGSSAAQLKSFLAAWGVSSAGCVERHDLLGLATLEVGKVMRLLLFSTKDAAEGRLRQLMNAGADRGFLESVFQFIIGIHGVVLAGPSPAATASSRSASGAAAGGAAASPTTPPAAAAGPSAAPAAGKRCAACGASPAHGDKMKKCSACRKVCYCSTTCQKQHWSAGHRQQCNQLQQAGGRG